MTDGTWAVWSRAFTDTRGSAGEWYRTESWMVVDDGTPSYCEDGAARRMAAAAQLGDEDALFVASPMTPAPAAPVRPGAS